MEAPLTYLSLGMWSSRRHTELSLLILPERFVFLADRTNLLAAVPSKPDRLLKQLGAKSPFSSSFYSSGCVFAFEVALASICGFDYSNPLCSQGRVALEVHHICKREFKTMESARSYYLNANPSKGPQREAGGEEGWCHTPVSQPASRATPDAAAGDLGSPSLAGGAAAAAEAAQRTGARVPGSPRQQGSPSEPEPARRRGTAKHSLLRRLEATPSLDSARSLGAHLEGESEGASEGGSSRSSLQFRTSLGELGEEGAATAGAARAAAAPTAPSAAAPALPAGGVAAALAKAAAEAAAGLALPRQTDPSHLSIPLAGNSETDGGAGGRAGQGALQGSSYGVVAGDGWDEGERRLTPEGHLQVGSAPNLSINLPDSPLVADSLHDGFPCAAPSPTPGAGGGVRAAGCAGGLRHTCSAGDLLAGPGAGGSALCHQLSSASYIWPSPCVWTSVSEVYEYRTIIFQFMHPDLPEMLRPVVEGNERLLKMYESGLPPWAAFMPAYGLYYRPWLRTATWLLYYAFSVFSLACGFYDLYKNLPGLQLLLSRLMASVWLPPSWTSMLTWLAEHAQFRLSILLTYLFGKSEVFVHFVRWSSSVGRGLRVALQPAVDAFGPPLVAAADAVRLFGLQAWQLLASFWLGVGSVLYVALAPFLQLLLDMLVSLAATFAPLLMMLYNSVVLPLAWALAAWRQLLAACSVLWVGLAQAGRGVAAGSSAAMAALAAGKAVRSASPDMASQVSWLYLIPAETLELLHSSALQVMRALQTVAKFALQMCSNAWRHRLTLQLRFLRTWRRGRHRLSIWLALPGRALAAAAAPIMHLVQLLLWLAVSDADRGSVSVREERDSQPQLEQEVVQGAEGQQGEEEQGLQEQRQTTGQASGASSPHLSSPRRRQQRDGRGGAAAAVNSAVEAGAGCECSLAAANSQESHVKAE